MFNKSFFISLFLITQVYSLWGMDYTYKDLDRDQDENQLYMIIVHEKDENGMPLPFLHKFTATLFKKLDTDKKESAFIEQAIKLHKSKHCECNNINIINK